MNWSLVRIVVVVGCLLNLIAAKTLSYDGSGAWEPVESKESAAECKQWTCSPGGLVWRQKNNPLTLYNNITGCDALVNKGIKKILFHGDSYMRHIYAAMLITLNGNYESGSMKPGGNDKCKYHQLFNEKDCNYFNLNHYGMVCDGRLLLDPLLTGLDKECEKGLGTVSLFSFGNHQLASGRYGINDPEAYKKFYAQNNCPELLSHQKQHDGSLGVDKMCSVWWISTHQRVRGYFLDETADKVRNFNVQMREFFDSGECGNMNYIDVFNMTDSLVVQHDAEARKMTWDQVHWSYEVNLIKAQIIINALLSSE